MITIISNYRYFVDIMNDSLRVASVLTKLQTAKVEEQNKEMIIVDYSDEGMCFFKVEKEENNKRYVEFTSTGA